MAYGRIKPAQVTGGTRVMPTRLSPLPVKGSARKPRITDPLGSVTRKAMGPTEAF